MPVRSSVSLWTERSMAARVQGEVYQAKDTRLERTVAIKILPEHLADNAERKERFGREARAISQLNHPNICTLFDVGEQDGIDYLVMEYVEGETLAERLTKGALPLDEALEYGIQIADGLDNAHRAGIVHRDLKPGNAMLTKLGVKLLDFGLAKLIESNEPSDDSQAPTLQKNLTRERAIMGTPRYMAPEQLEGGKADARTDLYAFGLVLREMLVGPKATSGESELSPPALRRVIEKCLDRDPDARWQTARDLTDELRWIASKPDETESPNMSLTQKPIVPVASELLGALAASAFWWALSSPAPARLRAASHFRLDLPEEVGVRGGNYSNPLVISRDGANIVFQAHDSDGVRHLYVRSLSEPDATLIPGTARADMPFLSWDGTTVGYFLPSGEIESVLLAGGAPRKISDAPLMRSGVAWGSDDTIVVSSAGLLWRVSASGGTLEPLQRPRPVEGDWGHRWPQFLPDGKTVLFTIQGVDGFRPALVSMETGDYHVVEELGMGRGARYLDSGHVVLAAEVRG